MMRTNRRKSGQLSAWIGLAAVLVIGLITTSAQPSAAAQVPPGTTLRGAPSSPQPTFPQSLGSKTALTPSTVTPIDTFTGLGFDACNAPSLATMKAWLTSPYRAVNIYMGGVDRACKAQPNLNAQWVQTVTKEGWALIPTYVGLQAPCFRAFKGEMDAAKAAAEGKSAANDAADRMQKLAMGAGSPVYLDIEPFNISNTHCDAAVIRFLNSWSSQLHLRGYVSGVYAESGNGMTVIIDALTSPSFVGPDDIWDANWDGTSSVFGDPDIPNSLWADHQRIHQYFGPHNETHDGVMLNIDSDAVDAATYGPGSAVPPGPPFVYQAFTDGTALNEWSEPTQSSSITGSIPYGGDVPIACQIAGKSVKGSTVWDQLMNGSYVADAYTTTPGWPSWSPNVPRCSPSPDGTHPAMPS